MPTKPEVRTVKIDLDKVDIDQIITEIETSHSGEVYKTYIIKKTPKGGLQMLKKEIPND